MQLFRMLQENYLLNRSFTFCFISLTGILSSSGFEPVQAAKSISGRVNMYKRALFNYFSVLFKSK
jgi:hypothetical protein